MHWFDTVGTDCSLVWMAGGDTMAVHISGSGGPLVQHASMRCPAANLDDHADKELPPTMGGH